MRDLTNPVSLLLLSLSLSLFWASAALPLRAQLKSAPPRSAEKADAEADRLFLQGVEALKNLDTVGLDAAISPPRQQRQIPILFGLAWIASNFDPIGLSLSKPSTALRQAQS